MVGKLLNRSATLGDLSSTRDFPLFVLLFLSSGKVGISWGSQAE